MKKVTCPLCNGEKVTPLYPVASDDPPLIAPCPYCNAKGYVWQ